MSSNVSEFDPSRKPRDRTAEEKEKKKKEKEQEKRNENNKKIIDTLRRNRPTNPKPGAS